MGIPILVRRHLYIETAQAVFKCSACLSGHYFFAVITPPEQSKFVNIQHTNSIRVFKPTWFLLHFGVILQLTYRLLMQHVRLATGMLFKKDVSKVQGKHNLNQSNWEAQKATSNHIKVDGMEIKVPNPVGYIRKGSSYRRFQRHGDEQATSYYLNQSYIYLYIYIIQTETISRNTHKVLKRNKNRVEKRDISKHVLFVNIILSREDVWNCEIFFHQRAKYGHTLIKLYIKKITPTKYE